MAPAAEEEDEPAPPEPEKMAAPPGPRKKASGVGFVSGADGSWPGIM